MTINLEQAKALEKALNEGRVPLLGEPDQASAAPEFVRRLSDLRPTLRRLALARACAQPWRNRRDEMRACFQWELDRATAEALEEYRSDPALIATVDDLFQAEPAPISEVLLNQIAVMGHVARCFSLVLASSASDLHAEWLQRERHYTMSLRREESARSKHCRGSPGGWSDTQ